eukprot:gene431-513_t
MRIISTLLLVALAITLISAECHSSKCIEIGESCAVTEDGYAYVCEFGSFCNLGMVDAPVCTKYVGEGGYCDGQMNQCFDDLQCVEQDGASSCQSLGYGIAGSSCNSALECSGNNMICQEGQCTLKNGATCNYDYECPFATYCNSTNECVPNLAIGANCTHVDGGANSQVCATGLVCSPTTSALDAFTCVEVASKKENEPCIASPDFNFNGHMPHPDCSVTSGLLCIANVCTKPTFTPATTNCSSTICSTDLEICACSAHGSADGICELSTNLNAECQESIQDLIECAQDNECKDTNNSPSTRNSCLFEHCSSYMCNNKCSVKTTVMDKDSCSSHPLFTACRSSSAFVKPSIAIALVFALVALFL